MFVIRFTYIEDGKFGVHQISDVVDFYFEKKIPREVVLNAIAKADEYKQSDECWNDDEYTDIVLAELTDYVPMRDINRADMFEIKVGY